MPWVHQRLVGGSRTPAAATTGTWNLIRDDKVVTQTGNGPKAERMPGLKRLVQWTIELRPAQALR
jgi:hypothetical protein